MKRILFLLIIISLTSGCPFIIPLPADHRQEIDCVRSQIAVGLTTREDVISKLGEPDVSRDRYILYQHKEYSGGAYVGVLIPVGQGVGGGTVGQVFMDLYFEFDIYGVLTEYRVDKYDKSFRSVKDDEDTSKMEDPCHPEKGMEACDPGVDSCP